MSSAELTSPSWFRVFFVGGAISYRALFNWIHPSIYIPTMLGSPVFQILFFTQIGRFSELESDAFFVVGNAVQVCSMSAIYGMTMTIANERQFGTLLSLLATPANRLALFLGRALAPIANGVLVSAFGFAVGVALLDLRLGSEQLLPLALVVVTTTASTTGLGMAIGSIGVRMRDVFFASNLVYFLMLLVCGVNVPVDSLPGWMQAISARLPLTHGIEAARGIVAGESLGDVSGLVTAEAAIGVVYVVVAYVMFRAFEYEGRRAGALETF